MVIIMKNFFKLITISIISVFILLFFICLTAFILPLEPIGQSQHISIYDSNDQLMYETNFTKSTDWIDQEHIPQLIKESFIAIEDKRFYYHFGFDPIRITKSLINNITNNKIVAGGSTISQQYARSLFLNNEKTLTRKLKEAFYSIQLEMKYNKETILEGYLNTLYFGHGVYGINEASSYFFNLPLDQLNIAQISILISIINAPSLYSPILNYENCLKKQHSILYTLYKSKIINKSEYEDALNYKIVISPQKNEVKLDGYYKDSVLRQLESLGYLDSKYLKNGLQVKTYYDPNVQKILQKAIFDYIKSNLQISSIIMEPYTFKVLAIAGGTDYTTSQYNRALDAKRQVASTIKPLLYYLALENGFSPSTLFLSAPTTFQINEKETYSPNNFSHSYPNTNISMINAIALSDNIYAVKTHLFLGMNTLKDGLDMFGIKIKKIVPSSALGTPLISIYDLTKIYNTFASEGYYSEPKFISLITDNQGNILYQDKNKLPRILNQDSTLILNQLLRAPYDIKNSNQVKPTMYGFEPRATTAAKSGSTDFDCLVMGFNPLYTIGIRTGFDDNSKLIEFSDKAAAKKIFKQVFNELMINKKDVWYSLTNNIYEKKVNPITGLEDSNGSTYWFRK